ncbi:PPP4R2-domain-containing protein [Amylocystis lapponica]|nr:PPP4R2-domain-containing protein [Amylocystis lapponica]
MVGEKSGAEFVWKPEYDDVLDHIASTDVVDVEWTHLRDIIKCKIDKNIAKFLSGAIDNNTRVATVTAPGPGGLKLPPFPRRQYNENNPNEPPKATLNAREATEFKEIIYAQLNEFERSPPFTIQRVCELCIRPQEHYIFLGKYLRAVEKALLVTSTWDAFPLTPEKPGGLPVSGPISTTSIALSTPSTPMFSPIPFLHEDARRSSSRSPPPSPLVLPSMAAGGSATIAPVTGVEGAGPQALGLVDELDDPSPGHLSEHPQPLSATTTVSTKPLFESLGERFVKAKTEAEVDTPESGGGA